MADPFPSVLRATLLTRPGCHLCEEFLAQLVAARPQLAGCVEIADVDSRPEWRRRYGYRIPALLDAHGELVCALRFDAQAVDEKLKNVPKA